MLMALTTLRRDLWIGTTKTIHRNLKVGIHREIKLHKLTYRNNHEIKINKFLQQLNIGE